MADADATGWEYVTVAGVAGFLGSFYLWEQVIVTAVLGAVVAGVWYHSPLPNGKTAGESA